MDLKFVSNPDVPKEGTGCYQRPLKRAALLRRPEQG